MLQNNFIYAQAKALFQTELDAGNILNTAIVFLADTGEIWTHGKYFATSLSAEEIENLITSSETIEEFIKQVSPAEVAISTTEPVNDEKIWIDPSDAEDTFVSSALPAAVTELTSSSSSEDIINAFGGAPEFDRILSQVRELNNVGFITINNDSTGGRIPATVKADKAASQLNISYIDGNTLVSLVVTNTDGTFNCVKSESAIGETTDLSNYLAKDNTTEYTPTSDYNPATKKYVDDAISTQTTNIISQITDSAPETLDTLNELAAALGDDPNFATTITNQIAGKANSVHTHAITDVTGLVNNGDGNSFLANDGTYKEIASSNQYLDMSIFTDGSKPLSEEDYQKVVNAYNNKVTTGYGGGRLFPMSIMYEQQSYVIIYNPNIPNSEDGVSVDAVNMNFMYIVVRESDKGFNLISDYMILQKSGDGTKFLSDDGSYKAVSTQIEEFSLPSTAYGMYPSSSNSDTIFQNIEFGNTFDQIMSGKNIADYTSNGYTYHCTYKNAQEDEGQSTRMIMLKFDVLTSNMSVQIGVYAIASVAIYQSSTQQHQNFISYVENINLSNLVSTVNQIPVSRVLSESEYKVLGETVNSNNVLYFVTPD